MTVIRVNGDPIEETEIQRETAVVQSVIAPQMPGEDPIVLRTRAREWAEENLIEATLLRQASRTEPEPLPEGRAPHSEEQLRLQRLIARIVAPAARPKHKEIVEFYRKNRDHFQMPVQARVAHIVKNVDESSTEGAALAGIQRVRDELAKGRPFGEVADELSDCAGKGGELPFFVRGEMVQAFEDVVFNLRVNETSGIFRTEFGYHIAMLLELRPAGIRLLDEVQEQISARLLEEKQQKRLHQYVDHLRARAVIERVGAPAL